ncbi:hypothetical protein CR513_30730, partial [Mucuna pruriens]
MVLDDLEEGEAEDNNEVDNKDGEGEVNAECSILGLVNMVPILILVDSDATHNFISKKFVETMGWQVEDTKPLRINLGDGFNAVACGKCKAIKLELEAREVTIDAFMFDLEGIDMVLGISWLAPLGKMLIDWGCKL